MKASRYFSASYDEARGHFLEAAEGAHAKLRSYKNPAKGPEGQELACDTAWLGEADAESVLVTLSATHGVEGFCGSGVQHGRLITGIAKELPRRTALLAIHAINPHGFAWLRRVSEENVDLNRNFVDFEAPLPDNFGYRQLAEAIAPEKWDDETIEETGGILSDYEKTHGARELQKAISGGQYSHPRGIFFGGRRPVWSHLILKRIFSQDLARARKIAVIDYHTGLGPRGHGERICIHGPGTPALQRAQDWYGGDITSPALGTSSATELSGVNVVGMAEALNPNQDLTAIALEFGTKPTPLVRLALRADNWLHHHGDLKSRQAKDIKRQIRDAFYQDADDWKDMIWERALETERLALRGLNES